MLYWLEECEKLKALEKDWGEKTFYPDFELRKGDYLKHFSPIFSSENNKDAYFFKWDIGNIGRYHLNCTDKAYFAIGDTWESFLEKMESYNPIYNDRGNCCLIYDIENGKRLMNDYPVFLKEAREEAKKVITKYEIESLREQIAALEGKI